MYKLIIIFSFCVAFYEKKNSSIELYERNSIFENEKNEDITIEEKKKRSECYYQKKEEVKKNKVKRSKYIQNVYF